MVKQQTHYVGDACDGGHRRERTMTIEPRPLTAEEDRFRVAKIAAAYPTSDYGMLYAALLHAEQRIAELEGVLRSTHDHYCDEAWTSRGLHAPQCLNYHL